MSDACPGAAHLSTVRMEIEQCRRFLAQCRALLAAVGPHPEAWRPRHVPRGGVRADERGARPSRSEGSGWVLDTGALLAYANDDLYLQSVVRSCRSRGRTLLVSGLSLREALASRGFPAQLAELINDPGTVLAEPRTWDARALSERVRRGGGDLCTAHVAQLAAQRRWPVLSDRPYQLSTTDRTLLVEPV